MIPLTGIRYVSRATMSSLSGLRSAVAKKSSTSAKSSTRLSSRGQVLPPRSIGASGTASSWSGRGRDDKSIAPNLRSVSTAPELSHSEGGATKASAHPNKMKVFASPERYVQGRDATEHLGAEMKKLGMEGPVVLVTSGTPRRMLGETWDRVLSENGYEYSLIQFAGICTQEEAERIADEAKRVGARTLIGVGGGQTIDAVRAASMLHKAEVVSCPTVASTDAPCNALAVLYHSDKSIDRYIFTPRHPTLVLVDTSLIARAPKRMLVGGLGDGLATWYEARAVMEANADNLHNGLATQTGFFALARLCRDIILEDGPAAVQSVEAKAVTPALERVVEANTLLSGLGAESAGLCIAHSVHNGITTQPQATNYTHGELVAFGLLTQLVLEGRCDAEVERILEFNCKVGLPVTLEEVGVDVNDETAIEEIAERALAPGESAHNEPFEVTTAMLADAIRAADVAGRLYREGKQ